MKHTFVVLNPDGSDDSREYDLPDCELAPKEIHPVVQSFYDGLLLRRTFGRGEEADLHELFVEHIEECKRITKALKEQFASRPPFDPTLTGKPITPEDILSHIKHHAETITREE